MGFLVFCGVGMLRLEGWKKMANIDKVARVKELFVP